MKYRFQMKDGIIYEGYTEIEIKDHIAIVKGEIEGELTPAMKLAIEAHGGLPVEEKSKPQKGQRKVKPIEWKEEVKDDSTSS